MQALISHIASPLRWRPLRTAFLISTVLLGQLATTTPALAVDEESNGAAMLARSGKQLVPGIEYKYVARKVSGISEGRTRLNCMLNRFGDLPSNLDGIAVDLAKVCLAVMERTAYASNVVPYSPEDGILAPYFLIAALKGYSHPDSGAAILITDAIGSAIRRDPRHLPVDETGRVQPLVAELNSPVGKQTINISNGVALDYGFYAAYTYYTSNILGKITPPSSWAALTQRDLEQLADKCVQNDKHTSVGECRLVGIEWFFRALPKLEAETAAFRAFSVSSGPTTQVQIPAPPPAREDSMAIFRGLSFGANPAQVEAKFPNLEVVNSASTWIYKRLKPSPVSIGNKSFQSLFFGFNEGRLGSIQLLNGDADAVFLSELFKALSASYGRPIAEGDPAIRNRDACFASNQTIVWMSWEPTLNSVKVEFFSALDPNVGTYRSAPYHASDECSRAVTEYSKSRRPRSTRQ